MDDLGPWRLVERSSKLAPRANEGVTTVRAIGRKPRVVYRGGGSWALLRLRPEGWVHIGDPDSHDGVIFDCYQGRTGARSKMFEVTSPDGQRRRFRHPLAPQEAMNNSFVAVSPDGQWMLSGEWGTVRRFLVFPTPTLNPRADAAGLPLAPDLTFDHEVGNVQGATFIDPCTLLCSTDDPDTTRWPVSRQLLQVDLPRPLDGQPITAHVSCLGALPMESRCHGTFEVEGIDYDPVTGDLRIEVVPPRLCGRVATSVYRYRR